MTADELRDESKTYGDAFARYVFAQAADEIERLTKALEHCTDAAGPGPSCAEYALEIERLIARVAELESPRDKWPVVDVRDGYQICACPLCGTEHIVGDSAIASEAK